VLGIGQEVLGKAVQKFVFRFEVRRVGTARFQEIAHQHVGEPERAPGWAVASLRRVVEVRWILSIRVSDVCRYVFLHHRQRVTCAGNNL
jgi:hypothetical protein